MKNNQRRREPVNLSGFSRATNMSEQATQRAKGEANRTGICAGEKERRFTGYRSALIMEEIDEEKTGK